MYFYSRRFGFVSFRDQTVAERVLDKTLSRGGKLLIDKYNVIS